MTPDNAPSEDDDASLDESKAPAHREGPTLFVVGTPIGNLGDITLRAIDTLRNVDRVVAEDTRRTRGLLSHLGIAGKSVDRLDAHADEAAIARIIRHLEAGERVAMVTDAGTPAVSDPGSALVQAAVVAGIPVVPIPGACAAVTAVSASGFASDNPPGFRFVGFLPRSGPERRETLALLTQTPELVVLYESPQRIAETLADLARAMPTRAAVVARELTKLHEELLRGTLSDLAAQSPERTWMGEIAVVLGPRGEDVAPSITEEELDQRIDAGLTKGRRAKDLAEELALETGLPKREVYARIVARR